MQRLDGRYRFWLAGLSALLLLPAFAGFVGLGWELGQLTGLLSLLACLLLGGAPVRPRSALPPALLSLPVHNALGWAALITALIHLGALAIADHRVLEYLKPTMPLYAWAGLLATLLLAALVITGQNGVRRRWWRDNRRFQIVHVLASCGLLALLAMHVVTTHRYLGGPGRIAWFAAVTIGAMLMLLRSRRAAVGGWQRKQVFGDSSMRVLLGIALSSAAVLVLAGDSARAALREPLLSRSKILPLDFPHEKHGAVNCLTCHHNYADGTGLDWCIHCHRSARADLREGAEARFHGFCLPCHRHPPAALEGHGPVSGCSSCHRPPRGPSITGLPVFQR